MNLQSSKLISYRRCSTGASYSWKSWNFSFDSPNPSFFNIAANKFLSSKKQTSPASAITSEFFIHAVHNSWFDVGEANRSGKNKHSRGSLLLILYLYAPSSSRRCEKRDQGCGDCSRLISLVGHLLINGKDSCWRSALWIEARFSICCYFSGKQKWEGRLSKSLYVFLVYVQKNWIARLVKIIKIASMASKCIRMYCKHWHFESNARSLFFVWSGVPEIFIPSLSISLA